MGIIPVPYPCQCWVPNPYLGRSDQFRNVYMMKFEQFPATVGQEVFTEGKPGGHLATGKGEPA